MKISKQEFALVEAVAEAQIKPQTEKPASHGRALVQDQAALLLIQFLAQAPSKTVEDVQVLGPQLQKWSPALAWASSGCCNHKGS